MLYQVMVSELNNGYENGDIVFQTTNKKEAIQYLHRFAKIKEPEDYHIGVHYQAYVIEKDSHGDVIDLRWIPNAIQPQRLVRNEYGITIDFETSVMLMDDALREELHAKLSPCSDQRFFNAYAKAHVQKFNELWEPAKIHPVW
jgi:hypothetical protein